MAHYHRERNHQGLGNELIDHLPPQRAGGPIRRRQRVGGLLSYYYRAAANWAFSSRTLRAQPRRRRVSQRIDSGATLTFEHFRNELRLVADVHVVLRFEPFGINPLQVREDSAHTVYLDAREEVERTLTRRAVRPK